MAARPKPADIDAYIASCSPDVQTVLVKIRQTIRKAAPRAVETISYGMPTFLQERVLIHFAAFKSHIGVFPPLRGDAELDKALAPYRGEKGNLRFPLDRRMPYGLIGRVVKARLRVVAARAAK